MRRSGTPDSCFERQLKAARWSWSDGYASVVELEVCRWNVASRCRVLPGWRWK